MGKLINMLQKQLKTEHKKEAEDCIRIYESLRDTNDGKVWEPQWNLLTTVEFKVLNERLYKPNSMGYIVLKGIESNRFKSRSRKHADIIKAWADGSDVEAMIGEKWVTSEYPSFLEGIQYRIKQ